MINNEWERSLDELNRTIQDAIDHQNYGRLNQNVTDTIGRAMEGLSRGLRNGIRYGSDAMNAAADNFAQRQRQAGNTPPFHNQGTGSAGGFTQNQGAGSAGGFTQNQRTGSAGGFTQNQRTGATGGFTQNQRTGSAGGFTQNQRTGAAGGFTHNQGAGSAGGFAQDQRTGTAGNSVHRGGILYLKGTAIKVGGIFLAITGYLGMIVTLIIGLMLLLGSSVTGWQMEINVMANLLSDKFIHNMSNNKQTKIMLLQTVSLHNIITIVQFKKMNTIILQTEEKHEKEKNVNRRVDGSHAAWKCQSCNGAPNFCSKFVWIFFMIASICLSFKVFPSSCK